jgi:vacuolar protein sorting-associated protein 13A/C
MNKKLDGCGPKTLATLLFSELGFILDDEQYRTALQMVDLFHFYLRQQQYRSFRPPKNVTPKDDPRAWFKFAGNAILSEIRERNRRQKWDFFVERRQDRINYIELYKKKLMCQLDPEVFAP